MTGSIEQALRNLLDAGFEANTHVLSCHCGGRWVVPHGVEILSHRCTHAPRRGYFDPLTGSRTDGSGLKGYSAPRSSSQSKPKTTKRCLGDSNEDFHFFPGLIRGAPLSPSGERGRDRRG
jgi:hypothetical protein